MCWLGFWIGVGSTLAFSTVMSLVVIWSNWHMPPDFAERSRDERASNDNVSVLHR